MNKNVDRAVLRYLEMTLLGLLLTDPPVYAIVKDMMTKYKQPSRKRCTAKYPPRGKVEQYPIQCWVEVGSNEG